MKKNLLLITIFLGLIAICKAQNRHDITAIVTDSITRQPLELTTIAVLKVSDSSLVSYTLTDKQGVFTLRNLKDNEPLRLLISHAGYESLRLRVKFGKAQTLSLGTLLLSGRTLAEVVIKGEIVPIVIKKDTIEFNAEAFKVRPNALVQDLLKKLPGVQVDRDGTITVNGKSVSKIKVDGRNFFANDPKIATRNLDADMIAKVQIYDDREDDPDHLVPEYKVDKIINLKFKKQFSKSTFGNVKVGAGTQKRYQLDGLYNQSVDNLQVSVIGNSNNLGSTQFIGTSLIGFGPSNGLQQLTNTGVNINDNFGKSVKLNLVYNFSNNINDNLQQKNVVQFLSDTSLTNNSANKTHSAFNNQTLNGTLEWAIDSLTNLKYTPQLGFNNNNATSLLNNLSYNNFTPLLSTSVNNSDNRGSGMQYQHNINYYHSFKKKGESLTISNDVQVSPGNQQGISVDDLISYTTGLTSDTLNRLANTGSKNTSVALTAGYNYPLSKTLTAGIAVTNNYSTNGTDLLTYQLDPKTGLYNVYLANQSSDLSRNEWLQSEHPQLIYRKDNINISIGFIAQTEQVDNQFNSNMPNLRQHFVYLFPSASISINKVSFNYTEDARQPGINQLQPITIIYSQLYSTKGNPDLKPTRTHNFSVNYNNFNMQSGLYTFLSAQVIVENNSIIQESFVNAQGAQLTTPINRNGRFTTYLNGSITKNITTIGDWKIREQININGSAGRNFFEANNQDGYQDTFALPLTQELIFSWNDVIEFEPSYHINPAITRYELVNYPAVSYVQQTISLPLDVQWPKRINWSINYTHIYNPLVAQGFQRQSNLVSFSIARALLQKDKGEIRLTCYDLLNQGVSAYHYASNNTVNDIQNEALRRYFMLSYSYRFAKTK